MLVPALVFFGVAPPTSVADTTTVVSLTFNDGHISQYDYGRPLLRAHGMQATFYVATGWVDAGTNSSMAAYQIRNLYREGDEIGGMGKDHKSLTDPTTDLAYKTAQVCDDRARLAQLGLDPRSFAYPQAAVNAEAKTIVSGCGYLSGRTIGGLPGTVAPYAETIPPADAYNVRTANFPTGPVTLATMQNAVTAASTNGGGWVPMSFNQVCHQGASNNSTCMASSKPVDDAVLGQFLDWLQNTGQSGGAPAGTSVNTVRNVMGAPAPPPLPPDPTTVSLTFNDGNATQYRNARPLLQANNLNASFYLPTNWIDRSFAATMPWWQVDDLYRDGNEIGGMGRDHKDLTQTYDPDPEVDYAYKRAQVCDDQARLTQRGYDPRTFDYPAGAFNATAKAIVQDCGYMAARASGGLSPSGPAYAETIPPKDAYAIRTPSATGSAPIQLADLQNYVSAAATHGGGWVPLSFTQVCDQSVADYTTCMQSFRPIDSGVFGQFLSWLANAGQSGGAPAGVQVKTVRDTIGAPPQPVLPPRPLAVSLTFDDGDESQFGTLDMLNQHGMNATYYINSADGHISMTWAQVQALADAGNDIGGHTLTHIDLTSSAYSFDEKYHEVCDNRANLIQRGFNPVSFAYPFGAYDDVAAGILQHCGYQSGRRAGGLNSAGPVYGETVPPADPYVVKTLFREASTPLELSDLTTGVEAAASHGGGWLTLVFHEICYQGTPDYSSCMQTFKPIDSQVFNSFLDWLATDAPASVSVKTMTQVMGGGDVVPAVRVTSPTAGEAVPPGAVPVSGTGAGDGGNVSVALYAGGYVTDSPLAAFTASNAGGSWSAATPSLADGTYTIQASQPRNSVVGHSAPVTFTVDSSDRTPPTVAIVDPTNGATVGTATPTISGTGGTAVGDASSVSVDIYSGSTASGTPVQTLTAAVTGDGSWSQTASDLSDGTYTARATQSDTEGNTGTSNAVTFVVDTTAPNVSITGPADGSVVGTATQAISGTGGTAPGDASSVSVRIYQGSTASGTPVQTLTASIAGDGTWSQSPASLSDGTYTAQASQSDGAGNTGTSNTVTFRVDVTAPAVSITSPSNGASLTDPSVSVSGTAGTATGDASSVSLKVYAGVSASGSPVQTINTSVSGGEWSTTVTGLAAGSYTLSASQQDSLGHVGTSAPVTITLTSPFTVTSVSPSPLSQGATAKALTVSGSGFTADVTVSFSGSGVTATNTSFVNSTTLSVTVDVVQNAATGGRNVIVTSTGQVPASCAGCLTIKAGPKANSVSPNVVGQGAVQKLVKISGSGFVANGTTVVFSGTGITATVQSVKASQLTLAVTVNGTATVGARDVTVVNPDGGRGTCTGCFSVSAGPKITAVTPSSLQRNTTTAITIDGSGFNSSTKVTLSGTGLSLSKLSIKSATRLTLSVKVSTSAATGGRAVTVTNSDGGTNTLLNGLTIT